MMPSELFPRTQRPVRIILCLACLGCFLCPLNAAKSEEEQDEVASDAALQTLWDDVDPEFRSLELDMMDPGVDTMDREGRKITRAEILRLMKKKQKASETKVLTREEKAQKRVQDREALRKQIADRRKMSPKSTMFIAPFWREPTQRTTPPPIQATTAVPVGESSSSNRNLNGDETVGARSPNVSTTVEPSAFVADTEEPAAILSRYTTESIPVEQPGASEEPITTASVREDGSHVLPPPANSEEVKPIGMEMDESKNTEPSEEGKLNDPSVGKPIFVDASEEATTKATRSEENVDAVVPDIISEQESITTPQVRVADITATTTPAPPMITDQPEATVASLTIAETNIRSHQPTTALPPTHGPLDDINQVPVREEVDAVIPQIISEQPLDLQFMSTTTPAPSVTDDNKRVAPCPFATTVAPPITTDSEARSQQSATTLPPTYKESADMNQITPSDDKAVLDHGDSSTVDGSIPSVTTAAPEPESKGESYTTVAPLTTQAAQKVIPSPRQSIEIRLPHFYARPTAPPRPVHKPLLIYASSPNGDPLLGAAQHTASVEKKEYETPLDTLDLTPPDAAGFAFMSEVHRKEPPMVHGIVLPTQPTPPKTADVEAMHPDTSHQKQTPASNFAVPSYPAAPLEEIQKFNPFIHPEQTIVPGVNAGYKSIPVELSHDKQSAPSYGQQKPNIVYVNKAPNYADMDWLSSRLLELMKPSATPFVETNDAAGVESQPGKVFPLPSGSQQPQFNKPYDSQIMQVEPLVSNFPPRPDQYQFAATVPHRTVGDNIDSGIHGLGDFPDPMGLSKKFIDQSPLGSSYIPIAHQRLRQNERTSSPSSDLKTPVHTITPSIGALTPKSQPQMYAGPYLTVVQGASHFPTPTSAGPAALREYRIEDSVIEESDYEKQRGEAFRKWKEALAEKRRSAARITTVGAAGTESLPSLSQSNQMVSVAPGDGRETSIKSVPASYSALPMKNPFAESAAKSSPYVTPAIGPGEFSQMIEDAKVNAVPMPLPRSPRPEFPVKHVTKRHTMASLGSTPSFEDIAAPKKHILVKFPQANTQGPEMPAWTSLVKDKHHHHHHHHHEHPGHIHTRVYHPPSWAVRPETPRPRIRIRDAFQDDQVVEARPFRNATQEKDVEDEPRQRWFTFPPMKTFIVGNGASPMNNASIMRMAFPSKQAYATAQQSSYPDSNFSSPVRTYSRTDAYGNGSPFISMLVRTPAPLLVEGPYGANNYRAQSVRTELPPPLSLPSYALPVDGYTKSAMKPHPVFYKNVARGCENGQCKETCLSANCVNPWESGTKFHPRRRRCDHGLSDLSETHFNLFGE